MEPFASLSATDVAVGPHADQLRREILAVARTMLARGLVAGTAGNVSARFGEGLLITPTRVHPDDLRPDGLVELDLRGEGGAGASLEWPMHTAIYRARADVSAIVHTHSPHAVARSFDRRPIVIETQERTYLGLERIEVAEPTTAGTWELASGALAALADRPAALLSRHGVVAVGRTPRDALEMATAVEHQAQIALLLR